MAFFESIDFYSYEKEVERLSAMYLMGHIKNMTYPQYKCKKIKSREKAVLYLNNQVMTVELKGLKIKKVDFWKDTPNRVYKLKIVATLPIENIKNAVIHESIEDGEE